MTIGIVINSKCTTLHTLGSELLESFTNLWLCMQHGPCGVCNLHDDCMIVKSKPE